MKIKLDENMPVMLAEILSAAGHDVDTVPQENLSGRPDSDVWQATQEAGRFLITQDLDFSDLPHYRPGTHHGLLLVRLNQPSRSKLVEYVHQLFETEEVETWHQCFVVATDLKTRVRRPQ